LACCGQPLITLITFRNSIAGRSGESLGLRYAVANLTSVVGPVILGIIGSALGLLSIFWTSAVMLGTGGKLTGSGADGQKAGKRSS